MRAFPAAGGGHAGGADKLKEQVRKNGQIDKVDHVTVTTEHVNGDKATVYFTETDKDGTTKKQEQHCDLKMEGGTWKVDFVM